MAKTKDNELQTILQEVQADLDTVLAGEREKLAKASPGEVTSPEVPPDTSATASKDGGSPEGSAPEGSPAGDSSPEGTPSGEETPGEKTAGEGSPDGAPADGASPDGDPAAGGGDGDFVTDPQALQAEYAKLPPEVLKAHYLACKAAMWAVTGGDDGAGAAPDAGTPPAPAPDAAAGAPAPGADAAAVPPPAPPAPAPDAGASAGAPPPAPPVATSPSPDQPPPALKSEVNANAKANGGQITTKSERELELEAQLAKTEQLTQAVVALTTRLAQTPRRKAVTSLSELNKTEPAQGSKVDPSTLSRKEIVARLSEKACDVNLKKSDRELINRYCVGSIDVSRIAHLLS